jgi:hypothetical protein
MGAEGAMGSGTIAPCKAGNKITVSGGFVIPQGVHVVFDAPEVVFDGTFTCPSGASFETRHEGPEL